MSSKLLHDHAEGGRRITDHPPSVFIPPSAFRLRLCLYSPSAFRLHSPLFRLPPSAFCLYSPSAFRLPPLFRLPPSAFRLLPSAFSLYSAFRLPPSAFIRLPPLFPGRISQHFHKRQLTVPPPKRISTGSTWYNRDNPYPRYSAVFGLTGGSHAASHRVLRRIDALRDVESHHRVQLRRREWPDDPCRGQHRAPQRYP